MISLLSFVWSLYCHTLNVLDIRLISTFALGLLDSYINSTIQDLLLFLYKNNRIFLQFLSTKSQNFRGFLCLFKFFFFFFET